MIIKMFLITALILFILGATWVKDGDAMNPPFKRRLVIDLTVIASLWLLFLIFYLTKTSSTSIIASTAINIGLLYFVAQMIYLIASISSLFKGLVDMLKKSGVKIPELPQEIIDETQKKDGK